MNTNMFRRSFFAVVAVFLTAVIAAPFAAPAQSAALTVEQRLQKALELRAELETQIRELEQEYAEQRIRNEQTEAERREEIRNHYPEIQKKVEARESLIVYESAIPEEAHFDEITDAVLYVYASEQERLERLFFGRGYSFAKTESIMRRQMSEAEFRRMADAEVNNNGSEEEARVSLAAAMASLKEKGKLA